MQSRSGHRRTWWLLFDMTLFYSERDSEQALPPKRNRIGFRRMVTEQYIICQAYIDRFCHLEIELTYVRTK